MTGPEHFAEAEGIVLGERCDFGCPHGGCAHEMAYLARAQVHALLALTEAYVAGATMRPEDRDEWDRVTGRLEPGELGEPGAGGLPGPAGRRPRSGPPGDLGLRRAAGDDRLARRA